MNSPGCCGAIRRSGSRRLGGCLRSANRQEHRTLKRNDDNSVSESSPRLPLHTPAFCSLRKVEPTRNRGLEALSPLTLEAVSKSRKDRKGGPAQPWAAPRGPGPKGHAKP